MVAVLGTTVDPAVVVPQTAIPAPPLPRSAPPADTPTRLPWIVAVAPSRRMPSPCV